MLTPCHRRWGSPHIAVIIQEGHVRFPATKRAILLQCAPAPNGGRDGRERIDHQKRERFSQELLKQNRPSVTASNGFPIEITPKNTEQRTRLSFRSHQFPVRCIHAQGLYLTSMLFGTALSPPSSGSFGPACLLSGPNPGNLSVYQMCAF